MDVEGGAEDLSKSMFGFDTYAYVKTCGESDSTASMTADDSTSKETAESTKSDDTST